MIATRQEITTRAEGRFRSLEEIKQLPLQIPKADDTVNSDSSGVDSSIRVLDVAQVTDKHKDERLRIRLNKVPGIKLSIQKQPQANSVAVVN